MKNAFSEIHNFFQCNEITRSQYVDKMYDLHKVLFFYKDFLCKTFVHQIYINDEDVIFELQNKIKLSLVPGDKYSLPLGFFNIGPYYEEKQWEHAFSTILNPKVIIDIGANIGYFSLYSSAKFPDSEIFCFEPAPVTFKSIEKNITLNKAGSIHPFNIGLSDSVCEKDLFFNPEYTASSSQRDLLEMDKTYKVRCHFSTLDKFVQEKSIKHVDFIKCDVEGSEKFVLFGARKTLEKFQPVVFVEMLRKWSAKFDYHPNEIIYFMKDLGYQCLAVAVDGLIPLHEMTDDVEETNFVFLPNNRALIHA